ncbi:MAG: transporter substrate-binding domain-containing protein [Pseudomonas sp.]|uniref:transporter substrate-binding domain-containing protein n=1 Tax=Pseudomonas abieticivorans TaxID=2931382 RepID=UPI0020BDE92D|nr:transporter substrate-binding domain-containing protein [Pseudomonas sp. PIA16]MDE1166728.1 transporter substrate-binding domain-containing protein [Pseudomonas sp.]
MARWMLVLVCWLGCTLVNAAQVAPPAQIRLVSEAWLDYTNADGTGLAWDVLRKVFEPAGVKVLPLSEPYTRAVGLVQRAEADAWVGSYHDETPNTVYPRWNFDTDHIYALGLASKPRPTLETLGQYRLAWVRGYAYQHYLPHIGSFSEVQRRTGILSMLAHDRADYYIDAQTEVATVLQKARDPAQYRLTHIAEIPLYLGFADTANGRALLALYDQRMDSLVPSGELRAIFDHWQQPYPFDDAKPAP